MSRPLSESLPWEFVPLPKEDELLSAWLNRSAAAHGLSFHRFAVNYLGSRALSYRDVDVFPSPALLTSIVVGSRTSAESVLDLTLVPYLKQMSSGAGRAGHFDAALPRVHVARAKFRHGQQACLGCLREGASYQRSWRLPFVLACERHEVWLRDGCPYCDAPIDPKCARLGPPTCPQCCRSWPGCVPVAGLLGESAVALQRRIVAALISGQDLAIHGQQVPLSDALRGFNFLLRIDRRLGREGALPIERAPLRAEGRRLRLQRVAEMLEAWPDEVAGDGLRLGMGCDPFPGEDCPAWILQGLAGLREVKPRERGTRDDEDPVLEVLRKRRPKNWRTRYAHRLVRLAGMDRGH